MGLALHGYWRSSTSWRVRIALELKGLDYEYVPVHLVRDGGEQYTDGYKALNPMSEVPSLVLADGTALAQSIAIIEYLEETTPEPPLLPADPVDRARVRQLTEVVNSSIHPVQNLRVLRAIGARYDVERAETLAWGAHWIARGFTGLEALLERTAGAHAFGDAITFADLAIVRERLLCGGRHRNARQRVQDPRHGDPQNEPSYHLHPSACATHAEITYRVERTRSMLPDPHGVAPTPQTNSPESTGPTRRRRTHASHGWRARQCADVLLRRLQVLDGVLRWRDRRRALLQTPDE